MALDYYLSSVTHGDVNSSLLTGTESLPHNSRAKQWGYDKYKHSEEQLLIRACTATRTPAETLGAYFSSSPSGK